MKKTYYEVLGVPESATISTIKTKYQLLQEKYDPKKNPEKKSTKKWKDIKEAYQVLSKKESKAAYDSTLNEKADDVMVEEVIPEAVEEAREIETEPEVKAYILPRVLAYFIDIFLVGMVASLLFGFFPQAENVQKLNEQMWEVQQNFASQKITPEQYVAQTMDLSYELATHNVIYVIIDVALAIGYFVIFQYRRNGQTIGKQLLRIRVVPRDKSKKLTMNHYLYRALILQSILINILSVIGVLMIPKSFFGSAIYSLSLVNAVIMIVTIVMVLFRKDGRGLHDMVSGTQVVMDGSKERVLCES